MRTIWRVLSAANILLVWGCCLLLSGHMCAQQEKQVVWQPILPKQEYDELVARALSSIQKDLTDIRMLGQKELKVRMKKLQATGIHLAALVQSNPDLAKDRKLATLRDVALDFSAVVRAGNVEAVIKAAGGFPVQNANPRAKLETMDLRSFVPDRKAIMFPMKRKAGGGEGLDPDLQDSDPLKGAMNGIEEKIQALAKNKLTDAQMKKQAEELGLMAYKVAAIAQLAEDWTPNIKNPVNGKKSRTQKNWVQWSGQMRKLALELAAAARKGKAEDVFEAAEKLNTNCLRCHTAFK